MILKGKTDDDKATKVKQLDNSRSNKEVLSITKKGKSKNGFWSTSGTGENQQCGSQPQQSDNTALDERDDDSLFDSFFKYISGEEENNDEILNKVEPKKKRRMFRLRRNRNDDKKGLLMRKKEKKKKSKWNKSNE